MTQTKPKGKVRRVLEGLSDDQIRQLLAVAERAEEQQLYTGPQTDDELWEYVKENYEIEIPRVAVCHDLGHVAPFEFFADAYFQRTKAAILLGPREGGKTQLMALLWAILAKFVRYIEMMTAGAIEAQAKRAQKHLRNLLRNDKGIKKKLDDARDHPEVEEIMTQLVKWKNGAELEIVTGTVNALNGPHPNKFHFDEIDLITDPQAWKESRNISSSANGIEKQDFVTSTRKTKYGLMQRLMNEVQAARDKDIEPAWDLYAFCIFEVAENVPNCGNGCGCEAVVSGTWKDENDQEVPRRFSDVCRGRLKRAKGFLPKVDIWSVFKQNDQETWEAQRECTQPETSGLVFKKFSRKRHGIRNFYLDPLNGPIFMSVDWGGVNPSAVGWYQLLKFDIEVSSYQGKSMRLRAGTLVRFDEIYEPDIGNIELAELVRAKEAVYRQQNPNFKVMKRFCDPQGAAARRDFKRMGLPTYWKATRDIMQQLKLCRKSLDADLFVVVVDKCPWFLEEIDMYHYPKTKGDAEHPEVPVDAFNHTMSEWRYCTANLDRLAPRGASKPAEVPAAAQHQHGTVEVIQSERNSLPVAASSSRYIEQLKHGPLGRR